MQSDALLEKLALGCRIIAMNGHSDIVWGHMSVRDPRDPQRFWMKGHEIELDEVTPQDMVLVDWQGKKLAGTRPRHSEYPIHSEIFRRRPEVNAVIHTHPMYGTIMAYMDADLQPVTHEGSIFVPPPVPRFNLTTGLIRTQEQGEALAQGLGSHRALLMQNHGVVLTGGNIEEATMLEKACQAQLTAMAAGTYRVTPPWEALEKQQTIYRPERSRLVWEYYSRKAPRW
ncbi:MAG: class II aldolase/adducin family protein [Dehalococcoidia bacterium]|nr:class II aldolase/adducin family protein [Dehalococcoidia bacterium]MSQ17166.1 class II aldolase/adducin family protein [Dehalococcoidia bacterium]